MVSALARPCLPSAMRHALCLAAAAAAAGSRPAAAADTCSAAGNWTCGSAYHARASALPGSFYFFVRVPPPTPGRSWVNATVAANGSRLSVTFNTGHTDTGVLSKDCTTIHWADKAVWSRTSGGVPPPPPAPPAPSPNPLCTSIPGRPTYHMCGELLKGTNHTTHANDINAIFWYKGLYHAMFQERKPYPCADWAHLVSKDMAVWKRLPDALSPTKGSVDGGGVLDGSVSLLPGLDPVIIYDAHGPERGRDCPVKHDAHQAAAAAVDDRVGDPPTLVIARPTDPSDPELLQWKKDNGLLKFPRGKYSGPTSVWYNPGKKTHLLRHFVLKVIVLPRQARDKHRDHSKREGWVWYTPSAAKLQPCDDQRSQRQFFVQYHGQDSENLDGECVLYQLSNGITVSSVLDAN